jgi:SOS-response transcriptional repressor LexA
MIYITLRQFSSKIPKIWKNLDFRSLNPLMEPVRVKTGDVNILGVIVGLFRNY